MMQPLIYCHRGVWLSNLFNNNHDMPIDYNIKNDTKGEMHTKMDTMHFISQYWSSNSWKPCRNMLRVASETVNIWEFVGRLSEADFWMYARPRVHKHGSKLPWTCGPRFREQNSWEKNPTTRFLAQYCTILAGFSYLSKVHSIC